MARLVAWDRLVRYRAKGSDEVRYGQPIVHEGQETEISAIARDSKLEVEILDGIHPLEAKPTGKTEHVGRLLGPLTPNDVPIIRCIGLNYKTHSAFLR
jgi:hypothetical protein